MRNRVLLGGVLGSAMALLTWVGPSGAGALRADAKAPTTERGVRGVVLVTIDTLRADHVGAYGGPVPTPHLDALAAEGVLVEQATTPIPSTGPAHASLFTGLHPWRHHILDNAVSLRRGSPTLAERLSAHGIRTAAFVSSYVLNERFHFSRGFATYVFAPTEGYRWRGEHRDRFWARGADTTAAASKWLTEAAADPRAFFLFVHYFDPHAPYVPPAGFTQSPDEVVDLSDKRLPPGVRGPKALARLIRAYRGEVRYVDFQVGLLLERLALLGIARDTAVIVTSDHGEGLGDHGVLEHGVNLFDELVRVPLIARGPGIPAGRRLSGAAQLEDLHPTILALFGAPPTPEVDGVDLGPWWRGEVSDSPRSAAVGRRKAFGSQPPLFYERRWPHKWIGSPDRRGHFYSLEVDPAEQSGARGDGPPPALAAELAGPQAPEPEPPTVDDETRRALEALGYLEPASAGSGDGESSADGPAISPAPGR